MRSQENAVSSVSSVSGGVDLSDMLMSPLLACSVCCDRFSRTELAEHMRTTHPSVSSSRHDRDESSSSHLELDDAIPRSGGKEEEEEEVLSLGLAYGAMLGADAASPLPEFHKPAPVVFSVPSDELVVTKVVQGAEAFNRTPTKPNNPQLENLVNERKRAATEKHVASVIDVDEGPAVSDEIEEAPRPASPEASSIPDIVEVVRPAKAGFEILEEAERNEKKKRSDLEKFVEANAVKKPIKIKPKAKKKKTAIPVDEEEEEEGVVPYSADEDHSSFSQNAILLNLAGSAPTTRRRRKDIEKLVGTDMLQKRSEAAVFAELQSRAQQDSSPSRKKRDQEEEEPANPSAKKKAGMVIEDAEDDFDDEFRDSEEIKKKKNETPKSAKKAKSKREDKTESSKKNGKKKVVIVEEKKPKKDSKKRPEADDISSKKSDLVEVVAPLKKKKKKSDDVAAAAAAPSKKNSDVAAPSKKNSDVAAPSKKNSDVAAAAPSKKAKLDEAPAAPSKKNSGVAAVAAAAPPKKSLLDEKKKQKESSVKEVTAVAPVQTTEGKKQKSPEMYSQIPKQQLGNAVIYDLSQPSQLLTLPLDPVDVLPEDGNEDEPKQKAPLETELSSYAATPDDVIDRGPSVVTKKPQFASPAVKKRGKVASPAVVRAQPKVEWTRGRIDNHVVRFCEPKNPSKLFAGFNFIVTGCKVVNELDRPEDHIGYFVNVGSQVDEHGEPVKQVLADWIHDVITNLGGKELLQDGALDMFRHRRMASFVEPVSGTPFEQNVICISEKPHRTVKWLLCVAANIPLVKWKWLHECVREEKLMDFRPFLLKTGFSILSSSVIPYTARKSKKLIFDGLKFEVCGSTRFREEWSMILREQGAECVIRLGLSNESSLDMILSQEDDEYPTNAMVKASAKLKIPIVSVEFVLQSVLVNRLLKPEEHDAFRAERK